MEEPDLEALRRHHRSGRARSSYQPSSRPPPRRGAGWLLAAVLTCGIAVLVYTVVTGASDPSSPSGAGAPSTAEATKEPTTSSRARAAAPSTTQVSRADAVAVVRRYFQAINDQDYVTAYELLGAYFHRRQSYEDFSVGFSETVHDQVRLVSTSPAGPTRYRVAIELSAEQRDGSVRQFSGTYVVGREGGELKVVTAQVRRTG